jgi:4-methyl-5(b-hydroxyethyl)-thiazole monophosphate biosynthesis
MKTALVLFASGSEELETVTIVNVLRRAGVKVTLAGLTIGVLQGARSINILPDCMLDDVLYDEFDIIVLPGGLPGTNHLRMDPRVISLLQRMNDQNKYLAAICAAPSVLAEAGLLDDKQATCYPGMMEGFPHVHLQASAIVEDGMLITSRGPGTAMDFALLLAEKLVGKAKRDEVEAALVR